MAWMKLKQRGCWKNIVLLIDVNILLDVLLAREEFLKESSLIWKLCETGRAVGYISTLTIANLVDIMRKKLIPEKTQEVINLLRLLFEFADLCVADVNLASRMECIDFEDVIQSATAQRIHADFIVTRNVRDFAKSRIPAFTPSELLARI